MDRLPRHQRLHFPSAALLALIAAGTWIGPAALAIDGDPPGDFAVERIAGGLVDPTDFVFLPDGRILVTERRGWVRMIANGTVLPVPFHKVETSYAERGLLGIAIDPDFETTGYVYLFHTYQDDPLNQAGPKTNRVVRVTALGNEAVPGSELVLIGTVGGTPATPSCDDYPVGTDCIPQDALSHAGGALRFGTDGTLFITTGDAVFSAVSVEQSLRAQDLDNLAGKVLRINRDGTAPQTNPYFNGDVGFNTYEEINVADPGANLGWPCFEGIGINTFYADSLVCQTLYATTPPNLRWPLSFYPRNTGAAVVGGVFSLEDAPYPAEFQEAYFHADFVRDEVRSLRKDPGIPFDPLSLQTVASVLGPADFENGPGGFVYVLSYLDGEILRLVHTSINVPPQVGASADVAAGLAPLGVQFSSAGTVDSNGDPITFNWDFGDGTASNDPNPSHTYTQDGLFDVTLTATDPSLASGTAELSILVGKEPPVPQIVSPQDGLAYQAGQVIQFSGLATDPDDGAIPDEDLYWLVRLIHCIEGVTEADCHFHPLVESSGPTLVLTGPQHGDPGADSFN